MPRVMFAGWEAAFGVCFLAFCWCVMALLVGLLGIAGVTGSLPFELGIAEVATWLACAALLAWFGSKIWRDLGHFRVIELAPDGGWILRNSLGWQLGCVAATEPRAVSVLQQKVWTFLGSASVSTRTHAVIEAGSRSFHSCQSLPHVTLKATADLRSPPFADGARAVT